MPSTVARCRTHTPRSELAIIKESGHPTMQDQPDENIRVVRAFLHKVENR